MQMRAQFLKRRILAATLASVALSGVFGCAQSSKKDGDYAPRAAAKEKILTTEAIADVAKTTDNSGSMAINRAAGDLQRKIIYDLSLSIVVTDFAGVQKQVEEAVRQSPQSYISAANVSGHTGNQRTGRWTIKVPQDQTDSLIQRLRALGEVKEERKSSQEVTDEYYDLQARLKNKQETEKRILALQAERKGELKDIVAVEEQVDKVREEIERMQGRLNRLEHLTSLVTVTLEVEEIREYKPENPIAFNERATSAFQSSWQNMKDAGEVAALGAIGMAPWLPVVAIVALALRWTWRRARPATATQKSAGK